MTGKERTAAARRSRTMAKLRRYAAELRAAGWKVEEPDGDRDPDR
jgi:hypothetical protein